MASVSLARISKSFGTVKAVDGVDLEIEKGELFFFLGPSGCGKSTLLRIVAGLETPDHGTVRFGERDVTRTPPHKRNAGLVFQNYALWPHLTVAQNVEYGLEARKISRAERLRRTTEALEMVRLQALANRRPGQLSGGQQQRVALARTLVIRPEVILLDEPLSNLDAALRLEMRAEIRRIHRETGITMIYVTHDQTEALSMADRLAVLMDGRVVQVGTPREIYYRPSDAFVARFIGEINLISGTVREIRDGLAKVDTGEGCIACATDEEIETGKAVTCGVRPEALTLRTPADEASDRYNRLEGKLTDSAFLGDRQEIRLEARSGIQVKITELNPRDISVRNGQAATAWFRASETLLFPAG